MYWCRAPEFPAEEAVPAEHSDRLGLTGTRWLVDSEVYPDKLTARGLEYMRPTTAERDEANRIIMDELVYGVFKPEAVACYKKVIGRMKEEGCAGRFKAWRRRHEGMKA